MPIFLVPLSVKPLYSFNASARAFSRRPCPAQRCCNLACAGDLTNIRMDHGISHRVVLWNIAAVALSASDVFASLYAGYFKSELRITLSMLSSVVNGAAAIMMFVFIDPYMSVMTDDVVEGKVSELEFRKFIVWLVGSRQSSRRNAAGAGSSCAIRFGYCVHC